MIEALAQAPALNAVRASLRLPPGGVDAALFAQALRRAAFFMAPAPRHEIERAVCASLRGFAADEEARSHRSDEKRLRRDQLCFRLPHFCIHG